VQESRGDRRGVEPSSATMAPPRQGGSRRLTGPPVLIGVGHGGNPAGGQDQSGSLAGTANGELAQDRFEQIAERAVPRTSAGETRARPPFLYATRPVPLLDPPAVLPIASRATLGATESGTQRRLLVLALPTFSRRGAGRVAPWAPLGLGRDAPDRWRSWRLRRLSTPRRRLWWVWRSWPRRVGWSRCALPCRP